MRQNIHHATKLATNKQNHKLFSSHVNQISFDSFSSDLNLCRV